MIDAGISTVSPEGEVSNSDDEWLIDPSAHNRHDFAPPTDPAAVFERFTRLETTAEVLDFATEFGWLGVNEEVLTSNGQRTHAERVKRWLTERRRLAEVAAWHEAVLERKDRWLQKRIKAFWPQNPDGRRIRFDYHLSTGGFWHCHQDDPYLFKGPQRPDCVRLGQTFVLVALNRALRGSGATRSAPLASPAAMVIGKRIEMRMRPNSLLGSLWSYLLEWVCEERQLRRCEAGDCGGYMDVTGCRSTKQFHKACAHRLRMRRARAKNAASPGL